MCAGAQHAACILRWRCQALLCGSPGHQNHVGTYWAGPPVRHPHLCHQPMNCSLKVKKLGLHHLGMKSPMRASLVIVSISCFSSTLNALMSGRTLFQPGGLCKRSVGWVQQRTWLCIQSQGLCRPPHSWYLKANQGLVARCAGSCFELQICLGSCSAAAVCWARAFYRVLQVLFTDCVAFRFSLSRR